MVAVAILALGGAGCGAGRAYIGHGRQASWYRVEPAPFSAGPTFAIGGIAAPGDPSMAWTAAGRVRAGGAAPARAAAWSSYDGSRWSRVDLDHGAAWASAASAAAGRQGVAVIVGSVTTARGDRDAAIWTSRDKATTWQPVALDPVPGDQTITSVAAGPLGFVAAGVDRQGDEARPAVWSSVDGTAWVRVGAGPASPFLADTRIEGVAVGPAGAVAVGTIDTSGDVDGMAWFSADGTAWRAVPLGGAGFTGRADQAVRAVTATAGGFVAVGDDADAERRVAVAWTSGDGITWQRQPPTSDMSGPAESTEGLSARAVAGAGPVVAVGGSHGLRVWTSPDGRRWTAEEAPVAERDATVATDGATVVVVAGGNRLWLRRAGGGWVDVGTEAALFPGGGAKSSITDVIRSGDGFVASGYDGAGQAIWYSPDGRTWERRKSAEASFTNGHIDALTSFGADVVGVGTARHPSRTDAQVAAVWRSADAGTTWARIDEANPGFFVRGSTQMFAVTAGGSGLVAVGLSWEGTIDAQAWSSVDGRSWRRASEPAAWSGPGDQYLNGVCALPAGGFLALGAVVDRGESDPWAWVSPDGVAWERVSLDGALGLTGPGGQHGNQCASTSAGVLVAGGTTGPGGMDGRLWATADGRTWEVRAGAGTVTAPGRDGLSRIAADGDRVVVTGYDGDDMTTFTSSDGGRTWRRWAPAGFGGPGSQWATNAVLAGDEVLVASRDETSTTIWIGPAP